MAKFQIQLESLSQGGLCPRYYEHDYPTFGNKNQAGKMLNCDLTNANYIQQGQGLATLTNGTQAGAVTTLMKGILDYAVTSDLTYGVGGNKVYSISPTTVTSGATFPHTIDKAAVTDEMGEDVALYLGNLYYSYNHSGTLPAGHHRGAHATGEAGEVRRHRRGMRRRYLRASGGTDAAR